MIIKIIGAVLVICACTGFGFRFAALHKKCERSLVELVQVIDYLICQIKYQKTPLALLFKQAAVSTSGSLKRLLLSFGEELESQVFPDIYEQLIRKPAAFGIGRAHGVRERLDGSERQIIHVRRDCFCIRT
jgi:stage III sporulation protein AB